MELTKIALRSHIGFMKYTRNTTSAILTYDERITVFGCFAYFSIKSVVQTGDRLKFVFSGLVRNLDIRVFSTSFSYTYMAQFRPHITRHIPASFSVENTVRRRNRTGKGNDLSGANAKDVSTVFFPQSFFGRFERARPGP